MRTQPGADAAVPMTKAPVVSIIIAAYDAADYVGAAIASAQAQTLRDIEIIVVDDASRDATAAIVGALASADLRIRLVTLPTNGGPGRARNAGLALAEGEWVAVLDADDLFAPDRLERLVALGTMSGAEMVADNLLLRDPAKSATLLPEHSAAGPFTIDAEAFIAGNKGRRNQGRQVLGFLKPLIRRGFLAQHAITYHEIRLAEDYFLYLECLIQGARWVVTPEPMYHYTVREGSLTATFTPTQLDSMARVDRLLLHREDVRARPELRRAIAEHLAAVTRAATWTRFVQAVRGRDLRLASQITLANRRAARDVVGEGLAAMPRVVRRLARSGVSGERAS